MPRRKISLWMVVLTVASSALAFALAAQDFGTAPVSVKVLVTVTSKVQAPPPEVPKDAVSIRLDGQSLPVEDWESASQDGSSLALIIDVDDYLEASFGGALEDIRPFIRALPPDALVEVAYSGVILQPFTTVHEAAAEAIRMPLGPAALPVDCSSGGRPCASPGICDGLTELEKHWPAEAERREVLFIGEGGYCAGNPDFADLIDRSHRQGVSIFTIYATGRGRGCLQTVSDETGGEALIGLPSTAPLKPYLDQLSTDLRNQYFLTFEAVGGYKIFTSKLQVNAKLPDIVVHAPIHVDVPASPAEP